MSASSGLSDEPNEGTIGPFIDYKAALKYSDPRSYAVEITRRRMQAGQLFYISDL